MKWYHDKFLFKKFVVSFAVGKTEFKIIDTKLYVPVVTLSTEDNIKLLNKLESGFITSINWNIYQPELTALPQ